MNKPIYQANQLLQCASAIFHSAAIFRRKDAGANFSGDLAAQVLSAFDQLEKTALERQINHAQVQLAKYALAAFMDELVLSSAWAGRAQWMGTPLQLQFFAEHLAGEGFFKRLQELRQNPQQNLELLEIYYICLQMGFEGKYRLCGLEQLLALQVDLRSQIENIRGTIDLNLSPEALPKKTVVAKLGFHLPFWVIASITSAIIFFIFLGFTIAMDHQSNVITNNIQHQKNILFKELMNPKN